MSANLSQEGSFITNGTKLRGSAMPRILAEFREAVIGRKIVDAGYCIIDGQPYPMLVLDDWSDLLIQADDECNRPGTITNSKGDKLCHTQLIP